MARGILAYQMWTVQHTYVVAQYYQHTDTLVYPVLVWYRASRLCEHVHTILDGVVYKALALTNIIFTCWIVGYFTQ